MQCIFMEKMQFSYKSIAKDTYLHNSKAFIDAIYHNENPWMCDQLIKHFKMVCNFNWF